VKAISLNDQWILHELPDSSPAETLPENLPGSGSLRLTVPGGMQILDICVSE
jgi:hypothetical protein